MWVYYFNNLNERRGNETRGGEVGMQRSKLEWVEPKDDR
jgi:hypothetical protein